MNKTIKTWLKKRVFYNDLLNIKLKYLKIRDAYYLQKNGLKTLILIDKIFKEVNIEYWLDTSTLLGAIREKKFIKGDNDLGLGINIKDYSMIIPKKLKENGILLLREYLVDNGNYGREQTYIYKGVEIDIFYHTINMKNKTTKYHSFISNGNSNNYLVKEALFPFEGLVKIDFLGKEYNVPKNYIEYTKVKYGEDFMIPNPKWVMADEKNAIILKDKFGKVVLYKNFNEEKL
ncbi:LicD family protein [Fusobacterium varium]|uniref:LicD family protein n=1 Tax=Fusobacterium varium TaxID=856 RepID=UPI0035633A99